MLSLVNDVFYPLMHQDVGGVEYDEAAALYPGAAYPKDEEKPNAYRAELLLFEQNGENGEKAEMKAAEGEAVMLAIFLVMLHRDKKARAEALHAQRKAEYAAEVAAAESTLLRRGAEGGVSWKRMVCLRQRGNP